MAEKQFNYDIIAVLLNATSVQVIERVKEKQNGTISDTDPAGAMHFTIAVVLVYGVGVIGLLGISARRNRRMEMMDKEVNKYIKSLHRDKPVRRKTKPKRSIYKLISSLHSRSTSSKDYNRFSSLHRDRFLRKSHSWSAGMIPISDRQKASTRSAGKSSHGIRTVLKQIAENQSEEAKALTESSPHFLASSSPTLHLDLSTIPQTDLAMAEAQDVSSSSTSADARDEVIKVTIVTPREEKQETVVNVSGTNDNTDHLGASASAMDGTEMPTDNKCPQVVISPRDQSARGHPEGDEKRFRKVILI